MPTVPVHDMVIQPQKNDLVIGTHGRGFWILDDVAILEELSEEVLASDLHLASVRPGHPDAQVQPGPGAVWVTATTRHRTPRMERSSPTTSTRR